ncbi:MAG: S41 family peptidase [Pseudomonadota bacterium]|nr:S41 family peptidase [Pseudomonadota bacterium]
MQQPLTRDTAWRVLATLHPLFGDGHMFVVYPDWADVVHRFGDTWVALDFANPLHFSGKTYVLVGRLTYSYAVLFSDVVQDFDFAQLVGTGGDARAR